MLRMYFLNLPAASCCSALGFFKFGGLHAVSPTTQERISPPTFDTAIPGWRTVASISGWNLSIRSSWDVLGPFPQHAREQHFLSPSFPFRSTFGYAAQTVCSDMLGTKMRTSSKLEPIVVSLHLSRMVGLSHGPTRRPPTRAS